MLDWIPGICAMAAVIFVLIMETQAVKFDQEMDVESNTIIANILKN